MLDGFGITCRDDLIPDHEGNGARQGNENGACAYIDPLTLLIYAGSWASYLNWS